MSENQFSKIEVTTENVWFLERTFSVFDILEIFPEDSFGMPNEKDNDESVKYLTIHTDLGFSFQTDIPKNKMALRSKSKSEAGPNRWIAESNLQAGDFICFEKIASHEFRLFKETKG